MQDSQLGHDLHLIKLEDASRSNSATHLLYAPLRRRALTLSDSEAAALVAGDLEEALSRNGFTTSQAIDPQPPTKKPFDFFDYNHAFLSITSACNLRCTYCYADGGEYSDVMSWDTYLALRDFIPGAARLNGNHYSVSFHGDGETLTQADLCFRIARDLHNLARVHGFKLSLGMTTNATLITEKNIKDLKECFSSISISFDGDPTAQTDNRPLANGKSSMPALMRGIRLVQEAGIAFGLRGTITVDTVDRMVAMVDFTKFVLGAQRLHLEPATACNRAGLDIMPDPEVYSSNFIAAKKRAKEIGLEFFTSCSKPDTLSQSFCGTANGGITLLANGDITACSRVTHASDPFFKKYNHAHYDREKKRFVVHQDVVDSLKTDMVVSAYQECSECFAKWHCNGICPASRDRGAAPFLCEVTKRLTLDDLLDKYAKNGFLNQHEEMLRIRKAIEDGVYEFEQHKSTDATKCAPESCSSCACKSKCG